MVQRSSFEVKGQQRMSRYVIFQLFLQAKMANNNEIWKEVLKKETNKWVKSNVKVKGQW